MLGGLCSHTIFPSPSNSSIRFGPFPYSKKRSRCLMAESADWTAEAQRQNAIEQTRARRVICAQSRIARREFQTIQKKEGLELPPNLFLPILPTVQIPKSYLSIFSLVKRIGWAMITVVGSSLLKVILPKPLTSIPS